MPIVKELEFNYIQLDAGSVSYLCFPTEILADPNYPDKGVVTKKIYVSIAEIESVDTPIKNGTKGEPNHEAAEIGMKSGHRFQIPMSVDAAMEVIKSKYEHLRQQQMAALTRKKLATGT